MSNTRAAVRMGVSIGLALRSAEAGRPDIARSTLDHALWEAARDPELSTILAEWMALESMAPLRAAVEAGNG